MSRTLTRAGMAATIPAPYIERTLVGLSQVASDNAPAMAHRLGMSRGSVSTALSKLMDLGLAACHGGRPQVWVITADGKALVDLIMEEDPDYDPVTQRGYMTEPAPLPSVPTAEQKIGYLLQIATQDVRQALARGDWAAIRDVAARAVELEAALTVLEQL